MDTFAVQLVIPLAGPTEDLHLQVVRAATTAGRDSVMPGAHIKNPSEEGLG